MSRAEDTASNLLRDQGIYGPPTPVDAIAEALGAIVSRQPFDKDDVSGLLFRDGKRTIIGVNASQAETRQRFTIAHELGHLLLHPGRPMILDRLVRVDLRDSRSSMATDRQEIEANQFAAAILMPELSIRGEVDRWMETHYGLSSELLLSSLADRFLVSQQAMAIRLNNLGIVPSI